MSVEVELQAGDPSRVGPYRLVAVLGSGGMGRVYLGRSVGGREVAVKVIRAELAADPEFRIRFRREVAAARLVNGLYTAAVIDADTEGPAPWLATAYIKAPSLADAVQDGGPLPPTALRALAAGLAEGLSAIHAAGVVHRDLKPSNVLLAADGPRVIDFGIAYAAGTSSLTGTDVVIGSPGYLSPEQAEPNCEIGPASDIFALGAVLCYAGTGRGPWGTGSTAALIYRVVHGEPDLAGVPDEIRSLVARCMTKLPHQRPTAAGVLAELGDSALISGWLARSSIDEASGLAQQPSRLAVLGSAPRVASSASSGPYAAPAVALDDTIDRGIPPGAPAGNTVPGGGAPVRFNHSSAGHTEARPRIRRQKRRLTLLAAAAAVAITVPLIIAQAQSGPGAKGHAPARTVTPGPPALVGVYSGPEYGFNRPNAIAADGSHAWILNGGNDSVTELDVRTGAWTQTLKAPRYGFKSTSDDTAGIVDDGTNVWVGNENTVTEMSAGTGSLVRILRAPASANLYGWYSALARTGTKLWGATPNTCRPFCNAASRTGLYASLIEFNASDGRYVRVVTRKTTQIPIALAGDGTHIWFAGSDINGSKTNGVDIAGSVTEFNADDGRQIWSRPATIFSSQQVPTADSIAYADGRLWVDNGRSLAELNASTGELIRVLYNFTSPAVIAAVGSHVFVVNIGGNSVTEIDASTGAVAYTLTAARFHFDDLAGVAVTGNRMWLLNSPPGAPSSVVELAMSAG